MVFINPKLIDTAVSRWLDLMDLPLIPSDTTYLATFRSPLSRPAYNIASHSTAIFQNQIDANDDLHCVRYKEWYNSIITI